MKHSSLDTLKHRAQTLNARPLFALPGVQQRQTDLAVLVEVGIKSRLTVVSKIRERGWRERIVVGEPHLKAEGAAVVGRILGATHHRPAMVDFGLVWNPEEAGIRQLHGALGVNGNATNGECGDRHRAFWAVGF